MALFSAKVEVRGTDMRPVQSVTSDAYGRFVVTLDDGQVWAQVEMESAVRPPKVGDGVTISLAALVACTN